MRAPARYSGAAGPGTLEMTTLATGGRWRERLVRPYSDARFVMIHGAPVSGMSTFITGLSSRTTALAASDDAWIALKRVGRSSMSVARSTRICDTWLFIDWSSAARRLTGTSAINLSLGSRSRSFRNRLSALLHIAITIVLTVPPTRVPSALRSASDTDSVLNERWLVMESLKIVFGARPRFRLRSPAPVRWRARTSAAAPSERAAVGSSVAIFRYWRAALPAAACSSSATPS